MAVKTRPREFRNLRPVPCAGEYEPSKGEKYTSFFLGPDRMICQERQDGKCILRGLVPVPIPDSFESAITAASRDPSETDILYRSWSGQVITDRNRGFSDALKATFVWADKKDARRDIYEQLRAKGSCISPYHGIVDAIDSCAGLKVRGLLVELADSPTSYEYKLGAAILVAKSEHAHKWRLTAKEPQALKKVRGSDEAQLVKCTMDELMGIALATKLPVVISTKLYEMAGVDGLLEQDPDTLKMSLQSPYFSSPKELKFWNMEQERREQARLRSLQRKAKPVPRAGEISDASTFLQMKTSEKRAILRATGVEELPRPREGPRAVDALMIPLLDEEVAYEVLRRLAETKGNFEEAAQMSDFESKKPIVARQIIEARKCGDRELEEQLMDELNSLSTLKFDPTNPDQLSGEWDVEEWYWEQRKRVYGIIAW